jgi:hypothetical protein
MEVIQVSEPKIEKWVTLKEVQAYLGVRERDCFAMDC